MLACSFLGAVLIYRTLASADQSLVQAGQFAIAMGIVRFLTSSIGSACDLAVLRRVPILHRSDRAAAADVMRAALLLRIGAFLLTVLVGVSCRSWLSARFLDGAEHARLIVLIVLAGGAELILRAVLAYFQAIERFDRFVLLEAMFQGGRLAATLALIGTGALSVDTVLIAYGALGVVAAVLGAVGVPAELFRPTLNRSAMVDVTRFFAWTVLALSISASNERLDLFLLGRLRGAEEAGLYGGVLTLATIPDFVGGLLVTLLQPRLMRLHERGELRRFWGRLLRVMLPAGIMSGAIVLFASDWIVVFVLGQRYAAGAAAFTLVALAAIAWLVMTPVPACLISLLAPQLTAVLSIAQLAMTAVACWLAIPHFGLLGAAGSVAGARVALALVIVVLGARMTSRAGG